MKIETKPILKARRLAVESDEITLALLLNKLISIALKINQLEATHATND